MIIALDGPAISGKGTLARRLAAQFGLAHLDTGLLYRAAGWRVLAAISAMRAAVLDRRDIGTVLICRPSRAVAC